MMSSVPETSKSAKKDAPPSGTKTSSKSQENVVESRSAESTDQSGSKENGERRGSGGLFGISSAWYSSVIQQAKEKTFNTYELVKKDIDEFSEAVQSEASHIASATSTVLRDQASSLATLLVEEEGSHHAQKTQSLPLTKTNDSPSKSQKFARDDGVEDSGNKANVSSEEDDGQGGWGWPVTSATAGQWMTTIVKGVNKVLAVEDTTEGEDKMEIPITAEACTRAQARLYAIQSDIGTYCKEPEGAPELFDDWLDHFSMEAHKDNISELLGKNPQMRTQYAQLVPSRVNNATFWQRYFYKVHQFELDEARRSALIKRSMDKEFMDSDKEILALKTSWGDSEPEPDEAGETQSQIPEPMISNQPTSGVPEAVEDVTPRSPEAVENISNLPEDIPLATPKQPITEASAKDEPISTELQKAQLSEEITGQSALLVEEPEYNSNSDNGTETWSVCSSKDITELPDSPPTTDLDGTTEPIDGKEINSTERSVSEQSSTPTPSQLEVCEKVEENGGKRKKPTGVSVKDEEEEENEDWVDWDSD